MKQHYSILNFTKAIVCNTCHKAKQKKLTFSINNFQFFFLLLNVLDLFEFFKCLQRMKDNLFYKDLLILLKGNLLQKSKLLDSIIIVVEFMISYFYESSGIIHQTTSLFSNTLNSKLGFTPSDYCTHQSYRSLLFNFKVI